MRVLFHGYNTYSQNPSGGVMVRMRQLADALRKEDIHVDFFDHNTMKVSDYDIIHFFRLDPEHYNLANYARAHGVKVVVSSIVSLIDGWKIKLVLALVHHPLMTIYNKCQSLINISSAIITETPRETEFIKKYYKVGSHKPVMIPNGIDAMENPTDEIYDSIGGKKKYVLMVGSFNHNKNQLNVIKALRNTEIDVVFIGGPSFENDSYYQKCMEASEGCKNLHFLGWLKNDSSLLRSAYCNAHVFVFPSYNETFGLVLLEAAIAGANLVVSKSLPILDYKEMKLCERIDPSNIEDIRFKTLASFQRSKNEDQKSIIKKSFSWHAVALQHKELYKSIL